MLCKATANHPLGENKGTSLAAKAGLALAAVLGTLLISSPADAQYRDDYDRGYNDRSHRSINSEDRNDDWGYGSRRDRPAYGDFHGDRYSPEPTYRTPRRDRLSRGDFLGRDRWNDRFDSDRRNRNDYDDHISRRIPLPDRNDDWLDLDRNRLPQHDLRDWDLYDPYEPLQPRDYDLPRLPVREDRRNRDDYRNDNDYRNDYRNERYEDRNDNDYRLPRPDVRPADELTESEQIQQRLSARYGNPVIQRFVFNVSPEQTLNVYREASQLIDSRHMQPTSYDVRTRRAATNLVQGLQNREFLAANRISPSASQVRSFESALNQLVQSRRVQNQNEAVQMVYAMANLAYEQVRIRPTTVVLEFIYGATETLDKFSTFLPEETAARLPSASVLEGSVVGIGVEIKPHDEGVEVVKAIRNSPAEAAGLKAGDIIVAINGKSLRGRSLNFAVEQIAGPAGSTVSLSVRRNGRQLSPMTLTRRQVKILSVSEVRMTGSQGDVGYIKLDTFAQNTSQEMDEALRNLHRSGMKSLVIDLRGNPGGLLTTAIEVSNKFLPSGTIVSTRGRTAQDNTTERANSNQTWKVPLVVLIDGESASASEIFAAAIQENGRGLVVGRQSYGKGTVQTHFPLRSVGGNLKLTTAKFYSPKGREMDEAGVTPDVQVTATTYRGSTSTSERDIQTAVEVAESSRVRDYLASTNQPGRLMGR